MQTPSDIELVRRTVDGNDRRAFGLLVERHQSALRKFLLGLTLGNRQLSDDLAQDTLLRAYTHASQYRGSASFRTWLLRIAYNVFYDYRRSRPEQEEAEMAEAAAFSGNQAEASATLMDIYHALSLLKGEERTCITLQLIEGEPIEHIAEITGMPPNTVKSHLKRGKENLTNYLRRNGYD